MDEQEFEGIEDDEDELDDLLEEDEEDEDAEEGIEEEPKKKKVKKQVGRPKRSQEDAAKTKVKKPATEDYKWKPFVQQAFEGYQNTETGEIVGNDDVIRRILCYAEEAAKNTR